MAIWTTAHEAKLADLWKCGLSASEIAEVMNQTVGRIPRAGKMPPRKITRGMVLGKVHRMGLEKRRA